MFSSDPQLSEFKSALAGVMQQHQAKNTLKAFLWLPIITSMWRRGQLQFYFSKCTRSRRHRPQWAAAGGLCWKGEGDATSGRWKGQGVASCVCGLKCLQLLHNLRSLRF